LVVRRHEPSVFMAAVRCYPSVVHPRNITAMTLAAALAVFGACKPKGTVDPSISEAQADAWAVHEALEQRIAAGGATEAERVSALEKARAAPDDGSAAYAYARAAVAGRMAEERGLQALDLLDEIRDWSSKSIERDASFQGMAATRMLGTLHVLAGRHFKGGDSERGLELLEQVLEAHPDAVVNHLRVAEAYVALGDPEPAFERLCVALAGRTQLTAEEQRLLDALVVDAGGAEVLGCPASDEAP
jgi:tetratricopeptide (TPR) repeat protein